MVSLSDFNSRDFFVFLITNHNVLRLLIVNSFVVFKPNRVREGQGSQNIFLAASVRKVARGNGCYFRSGHAVANRGLDEIVGQPFDDS